MFSNFWPSNSTATLPPDLTWLSLSASRATFSVVPVNRRWLESYWMTTALLARACCWASIETQCEEDEMPGLAVEKLMSEMLSSSGILCRAKKSKIGGQSMHWLPHQCPAPGYS